MGAENDPTAVVDPQLRVRGIRGLRVADASIMPRVVSGNTNGPAIMIGERCADFIKKQWQNDVGDRFGGGAGSQPNQNKPWNPTNVNKPWNQQPSFPKPWTQPGGYNRPSSTQKPYRGGSYGGGISAGGLVYDSNTSGSSFQGQGSPPNYSANPNAWGGSNNAQAARSGQWWSNKGYYNNWQG